MNRSPTVRHTDTSFPRDDGINRIYRVNVSSADYVALTRTKRSNGIVVEADINLNMKYSWSNGALSDTYDVWTVFLHEVGHVIGLADIYDSAYSDRVMYGYASKGEKKRTVTAAEKALVKQLYS